MAVLLCLCAGCGKQAETVFYSSEDVSADSVHYPEETVQEETAQEERDVEETPVCVYICGEVVHPGVYELPSGSRLYEAVNLAGGLTEEAEEAALNQAETVSDGQMIYVPGTQEAASSTVKEASGSAAAQGRGQGRVNINTADLAELMTLNGVGESRAESIIAYREQNGGFKAVEDIMKVTGIKEGLYEKIREQIAVN